DPRTIHELGFGRWCSEVLFYHYKWHILGTIGAVTVALMLLFMNLGVPDNDISVIIAVANPLDSEVINEIKVEIGEILGDANGDGEVIINVLHYHVNPDGSQDQTTQQNKETMTLSFLNDDFVLYFFDRKNLEIYNASGSGRFNVELADTFGGLDGMIELDHLPLFAQLGLTGEHELFACLKTQPFISSMDEDEFYENACKVVAGMLAKGGDDVQ
ncbi:MAG: hypothetical protein IKU55_05930, partial [Clostridia bacterium]|nr:hypothetical protein [Clostridia bacterium]